jgi:drug/metabolite transporter (DMT)-like permease
MGEISALTCALLWAFAVILFRRSGESVPPIALNLFRVSLSSLLFLLTLAVTGKGFFRQAPLVDYLILMASGIIAIAISDTLFHMCLNRVGAGINAIIDTLYSPFIILFAFVMLGERIGIMQFGGMALIIGGVLTATRVRPPRGIQRATLLAGIGFGVGAMATLAFGIVIAKPVLERSDIIWATSVRQFGSLMVLVPVTLALPQRRRYWAVMKPGPSWKFSLPGTVMGSYLALLFWIAGMKFTQAGTAAILNQTSTIYILVFASLFLKEAFTRRKLVAAMLAVAGIVLVLDLGH